MKAVAAGFGGDDGLVNAAAVGPGDCSNNAFVQQSGPAADVQKGVRLLCGDDFMQLVALGDLALMIILLSDLQDQIIGRWVGKPHKIELKGAALAGVPDLKQIGIDAH